eukprot:NODE_46_length_32145_cov_0.918711.p9 type:complete len:455 gc:universal NODE_46_length_32145_cov_0.918711:15560-14196(-)
MFCHFKNILNEWGEILLTLDRDVKDCSVLESSIMSVGWTTDTWYVYIDQISAFEKTESIQHATIIGEYIFTNTGNGIFAYTKYGYLIESHSAKSIVLSKCGYTSLGNIVLGKAFNVKADFINQLHIIQESKAQVEKIELDIDGILKQVYLHLKECVNLKFEASNETEDHRTGLAIKSIAQHILFGNNQLMLFYISTYVTIQSYQKNLNMLADLYDLWINHQLDLKEKYISLVGFSRSLFALTFEWDKTSDDITSKSLSILKSNEAIFEKNQDYYTCVLEFFHWILCLVQNKVPDADDKKLIAFCKSYPNLIETNVVETDENINLGTLIDLKSLPQVEFLKVNNPLNFKILVETLNDPYLVGIANNSVLCLASSDKAIINYRYQSGLLKFNGKYLVSLFQDEDYLKLIIFDKNGIMRHESNLSSVVSSYNLFVFSQTLTIVMNHSIYVRKFDDLF